MQQSCGRRGAFLLPLSLALSRFRLEMPLYPR